MRNSTCLSLRPQNIQWRSDEFPVLLFCAILLLVVVGLFGIWYGTGGGNAVLQNVLVSENRFVIVITSVLKTIIKLILHYFELCCENFEKLIYQDGYIGAPGWIAIGIYGILLVIVASDKIVKSLFFRKMLLLCVEKS